MIVGSNRVRFMQVSNRQRKGRGRKRSLWRRHRGSMLLTVLGLSSDGEKVVNRKFSTGFYRVFISLELW